MKKVILSIAIVLGSVSFATAANVNIADDQKTTTEQTTETTEKKEDCKKECEDKKTEEKTEDTANN